MKRYDPYRPVDPQRWLALSDTKRLDMILEYHRRAEVHLPNPQIHAHFHAIVETQVALGDEIPVRATLERLMAEGLDRHDAIHAIGYVLSGHIYDLLKGEIVEEDPNPAYFAALEKLTAESWLNEAEGDDDEEDDFEEDEEEYDFAEEEDDAEADDLAGEYEDEDEEDEEEEDEP